MFINCPTTLYGQQLSPTWSQHSNHHIRNPNETRIPVTSTFCHPQPLCRGVYPSVELLGWTPSARCWAWSVSSWGHLLADLSFDFLITLSLLGPVPWGSQGLSSESSLSTSLCSTTHAQFGTACPCPHIPPVLPHPSPSPRTNKSREKQLIIQSQYDFQGFQIFFPFTAVLPLFSALSTNILCTWSHRKAFGAAVNDSCKCSPCQPVHLGPLHTLTISACK